MEKRKLKRKIWIVSAVVLIFMVVLFFVVHLSKKNNEISDSTISELFKEKSLEDSRILDFEYDYSEIDPMNYIQTDSYNISAEPERVDLSIIGDTEVVYTIKNKNVSKDVKCVFKIKDTQAPVISFVNDSLIVSSYDEADFIANIQSVEDPVDGSLIYLENRPEKNAPDAFGKVYDSGWFTISYTESDNSVLVHAEDIHGNISEKKFNVRFDNALSKQGLYYYPSLDLSDGSEWVELNSDFNWYYSSCTYLSDKYQSVEEALQDVINYEVGKDNVTNVRDNARIFCEKDEKGNVLYYQAGIEY